MGRPPSLRARRGVAQAARGDAPADAAIVRSKAAGQRPVDSHAPPAVETAALLARLPLFAQLRPEHLRAVAAQARRIVAPRGTVLFRRGDAAIAMYVIVYGQVKLAFVGGNGVEKVIAVRGAGQSFGEAVMFLGEPQMVTATSLVDSLVLALPVEAIVARIEGEAGFARSMIGGLSRRLHELVADVEWLSTRSGRERVIGFLLRECGARAGRDSRHARDEPAPPAFDIELPVAKGVIASRLNLTQEHFSRILRELSDDGLIAVRGRRVRVLDLARLRGGLD